MFKHNFRHRGAGTATNGSQKWNRHAITLLEIMCRGFFTIQTAIANRILENKTLPRGHECYTLVNTMAATHLCRPFAIVSDKLRTVHAPFNYRNQRTMLLRTWRLFFVQVWYFLCSIFGQLLRVLPIWPPLLWVCGTLLYNDHGFTVSWCETACFWRRRANFAAYAANAQPS